MDVLAMLALAAAAFAALFAFVAACARIVGDGR
jgi:hypothetical protein